MSSSFLEASAKPGAGMRSGGRTLGNSTREPEPVTERNRETGVEGIACARRIDHIYTRCRHDRVEIVAQNERAVCPHRDNNGADTSRRKSAASSRVSVGSSGARPWRIRSSLSFGVK